MKLLQAPRSPFCIKVRLALHELGLADRVAVVTVDPWREETLRALNPLCQVPTLELAGGRALYDSRVICGYLSSLAGDALTPRADAERWRALTLEALGDGLAAAVIRRFVERLGPPSDRVAAVIDRQERAIGAALAALEGDVPPVGPIATVGEIAVVAALTYLSVRSPEIAWRDGRPVLAAWLDGFARRPSFTAAGCGAIMAQAGRG